RQGLGKTDGPCSLLSCLDPRVTISVSPPSKILGPDCAESAALHIQEQHWGNYVSWNQQLPGSAPTLMIYEKGKRPSGSQIVSLAPSLAIQAEDDTDYYCFSWTDGSKVSTVLQARVEREKNRLPSQPWGSQGKLFAPPFLGGEGLVWGHSAQLWGHRRQDALTMSSTAWSPLLLTLVALCTGSWAQAVLTQSPSVSGSPRQRVTISCTGSSSNVGGNYVSWYQQLPGTDPKTLIYDCNKHQGSGVPCRFSGCKDASANTRRLLVSGLQPKAEAYYACAVGHGSSNAYTALQTREEVRRHLHSRLLEARMKSSSGQI
ncbi:hypothetical protein Celaphus_00000098, partial [Cervus elaphus hippelaphus]